MQQEPAGDHGPGACPPPARPSSPDLRRGVPDPGAAAPFPEGAASRRSRFSPRNNRIGAAMKMDEEVPTTIPNSITQANPEIDSPPNSASGRLARNTVIDVPSVRFRVSLIDRSINSRNGIVLYLRRFSRTRSYTTTLSFVE